MKLTFSTLGCPGWGEEAVMALAKRFGFDSVEIRGLGEALDVDQIEALKPQNRAILAARLRAQGMSICSLDASAALASDKSWSRVYAEAAYAISAAAEMNIPYIRVFGGGYPAEDSEAPRRVARRLDELCRVDRRVTVLLETHDSFSDVRSIEPVVQAVGSDNFGLLWDVEHTLRTGTDSRAFVSRFAPLIRHVHLKDYTQDGLCLPGEGLVDLPGTAALLEEAGYDGYFSLEWEKRWVASLPEIEPALERFAAVMRGD